MLKKLRELGLFISKNISACIYGGFLLFVIVITNVVTTSIPRYDLIFIAAVFFQIFLILFKKESWREVGIVFLFHIVATLMELFKTSSNIGSWNYPLIGETFFRVFNVPLFVGFLYSSVGSYISRAIRIFRMRFVYYPHQLWVYILSLFIYINFFTHHYFFDLRYLIFGLSCLLFWKTRIYFLIYKKERNISFIAAGLLTACFVWLAENIASFTKLWLYPHQEGIWQPVSFHKIGAWFLLLIVSFSLISIIYPERFFKQKS